MTDGNSEINEWGGISMGKKLLSILLAGMLCLHMTIPALGAGPPPDQEAAAAYVREQGIMVEIGRAHV